MLGLILKGCDRYIFASLFLGLNESTCQIKKNVFYFTSKPLFVLEKIEFRILHFQISWRHQMLKHKTRNKFHWMALKVTSLLMKFAQFMSHYKKKKLIKKFCRNCGLKTSSRLFCVCKELSTDSIGKWNFWSKLLILDM